MSDAILTTLLAKGLGFVLQGERLRIRARKGVVTPEERVWLANNRGLVIAYVRAQKDHQTDTPHAGPSLPTNTPQLLLEALWEAGFRLELVASSNAPSRYILMPRGEAETDSKLFELYDRYHDEAVRLILSLLPKKDGRPNVPWWNTRGRTPASASQSLSPLSQ
ncbi:TubC N-terminal docking domain-related protein [Thermopirellula anaerolimosa]